jgi:hypothetical protein
MNGVEVVMMAISLLIAMVGGIVIGVIVIVSAASRREDRLYSLTGEAPGPACEGARWLTGVGVRGYGSAPAGRAGGESGDRDVPEQGPYP